MGPDNIPNILLTQCARLSSKLLAHLFNLLFVRPPPWSQSTSVKVIEQSYLAILQFLTSYHGAHRKRLPSFTSHKLIHLSLFGFLKSHSAAEQTASVCEAKKCTISVVFKILPRHLEPFLTWPCSRNFNLASKASSFLGSATICLIGFRLLWSLAVCQIRFQFQPECRRKVMPTLF